MQAANNGIVKNSALNAAAGMAVLVTGFISAVIVARLLGPEANGAIAFSLWLVTTGSLVAELGTGVSLLRLLPQLAARGHDHAARRRFAAYLAWPVVLSTLILAAGYAIIAMRSGQMQWLDATPEIVAVTGILFVIQSIGSFSKNYLIGEQRLSDFFKLSTISAILQLLTVSVGAWYYGVIGALFGYAAGQITLFGSTLAILRSRPDSCGLGMRQVASSSAIVIVELFVSAIFLTRPEILFLQQFQTVEAVGYYAVALSLANLALQLPIQLMGSLLPYYASHLEKNDGVLPAGIFQTVVRNFAYLTLPMSFGLAAVAEPLVTSIYGPAFRNSGIIVAILALGAPANVFLQLCTQYIFSIDRPGIKLNTAVLGAIAMVAGLLLVVPHYGGEGAAIARNIVLVGMCIYMMRFIKLSGKSHSIAKSLLRVILASLVVALVAFAMCQSVEGIIGVALGIIAGAAVYAPALRIFKAIDPSDMALLRATGEKIPAKLRPLYTLILNMAAPPEDKAADKPKKRD